jgi:hypothetical protein
VHSLAIAASIMATRQEWARRLFVRNNAPMVLPGDAALQQTILAYRWYRTRMSRYIWHWLPACRDLATPVISSGQPPSLGAYAAGRLGVICGDRKPRLVHGLRESHRLWPSVGVANHTRWTPDPLAVGAL